MAKTINFIKRAIRKYFEISAQSYAWRCSGNAWVDPSGFVSKA